jgi:hypothetical protein
MVRDPWTFAATFALGFIAWVVALLVFSNPEKSSQGSCLTILKSRSRVAVDL